jgi:LPS export ABC transporter protein LptC
MRLLIKIIFIIIFFILFISCENKENNSKNKLKADLKSVNTNTIILNGVKFSNTKDGKVIWELIADNAKIDKNKNLADLEGVFIKFNKKDINAKSEKGKYYLKSKNGELYNNVTIYGKLWKIKSNRAFLDNENKKIILNSKFKFFGNNLFLQGSKLVMLTEKKKFIISGRVKSIWSKK